MRVLIFLISSLLLGSCATPTSVQRESDYELCRLSILRPPLQSNSAINEADRQIRIRGVNCAAYAGTILQQQQQGFEQMQQGMKQMQQGSGIPSGRNQNRTNQMNVSCTKIGDMRGQIYVFNSISCPVGYAPSY